MTALGGEAVDVTDLPSAPRTSTAVAQSPTPHAGELPRAGSADDHPPAAAKPVSATAALVRKNPFDDPNAPEAPPAAPGQTPQDLMTSGDRSKLLQAKNQLLTRQRSGQASDKELRLLRALCKQLGDASCSN